MNKINMERVVRRSLKAVGQYKFHRGHAAEATQVLRFLEKKNGRADPVNLKLADTYAHDVFGDAKYAPWLRVYAAFTGTFKEGWIPDNYYGSVVVPSMKGGYGKISDLKPMSRAIFGGEAFPDLAYFANGLFFTDRHVVVPEEELERVVFRQSEKVVFKLDGSAQGKGIHFFDRTSFDRKLIKSLGNGVIQKFIVQHPVLAAFASKSVATLRFTTVVDDFGRISLRACFLRIGRARDTHIKVEDEVCVPVNLMTGELAREGFLSDWGATEEHPDSKVKFAGVKIPAFDDCVDTVLQLHGKIPFARCIGWDITVDADSKVQVMEWNGEHNDVKFSEATQGPCFSDLRWELLNAGAL
ncbi:MAG TPA: sugar-transfer associated ATP-grasp domain-containing protein [Paraburkholderia sp.]|uniref:sugar-transfer associated ATP-grasp domain-containing protein n=1 Tax=Paraburkholderia sp. TaxID=1926495 RepID=UPI002ED0952E